MASSIMVCQGNGFVPASSILVSAADAQYTSGFWTYIKHSDGTVGISAYAGFDEEITIPSQIDNMIVNKIEDKAFFNNKNVNIIHIADAVTAIGYMAFAGSGITSISSFKGSFL